MIVRYSSLLIAIFLAFSIFVLFQIKFKAQYLSRDVSELKRQLEQERESIHILKAEWAYLNQPHKLRNLVDRHLNLSEVKISQIHKFDQNENDVFAVASEDTKIPQGDPNIHKVKAGINKKAKWNFKDKNMFIYRPGSKKLLISISGE